MKFQLSDFGNRVNGEAGILQLMDDLGAAMASGAPKAMFGGGNPAHIPGVTAAFEKSLHDLLSDPARTSAMFGNYDTPQGNDVFISAVVDFFNRTYGWEITRDHVAITPGSQNGFFMLFNLLAGQRDGQQRRILLPLVPEYIGYVDQQIEPDGFVSTRPRIELIGEHEYKYHVDLESLEIDESVAALCVSRPTNPTGNVLSDAEIAQLAARAKAAGIPLIVDNAYGLPFPGVVQVPITLPWDRDNGNIVLSFSLSKIGLPSSRVGIFVGPPQLMRALSQANAIVSLSSPSFGQYVMAPLLESGKVSELASEHIQPYYLERATTAREQMFAVFPADLPWRLHVYEGAYFFWLWCEGAKKTADEMYRYLKERGVIVVPGHYFFPGQEGSDWPHTQECLRLNFARPDAELAAGIPILAEMIRWAYEDQL